MICERLTVSKRNGFLGFIDEGGHESRHESIQRMITLADRTYGMLDFEPVLINTSDRPLDQPCLSFSTTPSHRDIAIPDFLFDGWPEVGIRDYEQTRREVADAGWAEATSDVCGWIGNADTHPIRRRLLEISEGSELIDARHTPWPPETSSRLTLAQQVRNWSMLLDVEGKGWSGRLKLLLHSGRPVLVQERPWREWWWEDFFPWIHYIPVREDLSDLESRVEGVLADPETARQIGIRGQEFAREVLTRQHALARWTSVLGGAR